jgi:ribosomal protein S18 acetylase RimI-like enzyme
MKILEIRNDIAQEDVSSLIPVFTEAFGKPPSDNFYERLNEKNGLSVLLAKEDESLVGFKIGYTRFQGIYFSWLGAIATAHRRKGIARALLREQHRLCAERGFNEIQTEASSTNRDMLILNLQEGFDVFGVHMGHKGLTVELRKFIQQKSSFTI